jgi:hypothetical protein
VRGTCLYNKPTSGFEVREVESKSLAIFLFVNKIIDQEIFGAVVVHDIIDLRRET